MAPSRLLTPDDPPPVWETNKAASSPFLLTCDHAGDRVPRRLDNLGLSAEDLRRHIAWDPGAWGTSEHLATVLGAHLIGQPYSRLVIDCNRHPGTPGSVATESDGTPVPGNQGLSPDQRRSREEEIFAPYHARIAAAFAERAEASRPTALVAMHSFTPVFQGVARPWHIGILSARDRRLANPLLEVLAQEPGLVVGDNEPYSGVDGLDYSIHLYGEARGAPYVEVEIRQDLVADEAGQRQWAERLGRLLPEAYRRMMSAT